MPSWKKGRLDGKTANATSTPVPACRLDESTQLRRRVDVFDRETNRESALISLTATMTANLPSSGATERVEESNFRLLVFNLTTDAADPILGFTTKWLNALSAHASHIDVITMSTGKLELSDNVRVYSLGKERGLNKIQRIREFYRLLGKLSSTQRYDACFGHMAQVFIAMAGPWLRAKRIPTTLWYTHRSRPLSLRLACLFADQIVTAVPTSFPLPTKHGLALGHGIDTDYYIPIPGSRSPKPLVVQVARLSPIKNQASLVRAMANVDADLALVGGAPQGSSGSYREELVELAARLGLSDRVTFTGELPPEKALKWMRRAHVSVNLSPEGLFDKAALESMACGIPTITSNPAFHRVYESLTDQLSVERADDERSLAAALNRVLHWSAEEQESAGLELRGRVVRQHGLKELAERLTRLLKTGKPPEGAIPTTGLVSNTR